MCIRFMSYKSLQSARSYSREQCYVDSHCAEIKKENVSIGSRGTGEVSVLHVQDAD